MIEPGWSEVGSANEDYMRQAISALMDGALVTDFVVVAEVFDPQADENPAIASFSPEGQPTWRTIGMIDFARDVTYAAARGDS